MRFTEQLDARPSVGTIAGSFDGEEGVADRADREWDALGVEMPATTH